jgi:hypothetical protein
VPQEVEPETFEVWTENWPALTVFMACSTQWMTGDAGPTGLKYEVLPFLFKTYGIKKKDRADMLTDIKTCERVALNEWGKKRG